MRLIDADQYAVEMKMRQDAVQASVEHPIADRYYTDKEHWEGVLLAFAEAKLTLDKQPTINAAPVKHGRWELVDEAEPRRYGCSKCSCLSWYGTYKYCPNCGAKMDLEE